MLFPQRSERVWLVESLNEPNSRLAALCNEMECLEAAGRKLAPVFNSRKVKKMIRRTNFSQQDAVLGNTGNKKTNALYARFHALEEAINTKLWQYSSYPKLFFDIQRGEWGKTDSWQEENPKDYVTIMYLVHLVRLGLLTNIRQCVNCQQWFVARRTTQTCCKTKCRKKRGSVDANFKTQRKLYMRRYRADAKDRASRRISTR